MPNRLRRLAGEGEEEDEGDAFGASDSSSVSSTRDRTPSPHRAEVGKWGDESEEEESSLEEENRMKSTRLAVSQRAVVNGSQSGPPVIRTSPHGNGKSEGTSFRRRQEGESRKGKSLPEGEVPRDARYFLHDSRSNTERPVPVRDRQKPAENEPQGPWKHDKYYELLRRDDAAYGWDEDTWTGWSGGIASWHGWGSDWSTDWNQWHGRGAAAAAWSSGDWTSSESVGGALDGYGTRAGANIEGSDSVPRTTKRLPYSQMQF